MKINNTISLISKTLFAIVLLSQLAACNFVASVSGSVGDVQSVDAEGYDAEVIVNETGSSVEEIGHSVINKTLSWTVPVARENALPISMAEISGFRVYYGTKQGEYKQYVEIDDVYTDELELNVFKLEPDTYYLVVTTIDSKGLESAFSEAVVIEV